MTLPAHTWIICCCLALAGLLLACGAPLSINRGARWACPSPQPLPWGQAGPVKGYHPVGTPDPTSLVQAQEPIYYAEWEREYGESGTLLDGAAPLPGPVFPSPTPYAITGQSFSFGQRVELAPLFLMVDAHADQALDTGWQRYWIDLTWHNPTQNAIAFDYAQQVSLRTIQRADGTLQSAEGWRVELGEAGQQAMPASIAPGTSTIHLPILAPAGQPHMVEVQMPVESNIVAGSQATTPTPNQELRNPRQRILVVQWAATAPLNPPCSDPGALTEWSDSTSVKAIPRDAALVLQAPPGAPRVVDIALKQVGKPYIWGAEGPDSFDCSGLMQWSYAQIGITIPRTTATQWPAMHRTALSSVQPGDLVYMDTSEPFLGTPRKVTHVGMLADVNSDGHWDLIHAASPKLGVRVDYDVFSSPYYAPRLFSEARTVR